MSMKLHDLHALMEVEAKEKKIPLTGNFEITPRCNLNCIMCYVRKHPADLLAIEQEMTAEDIISIARQARDMGMLNILLTGGEILIRKDFRYLYEEIINMGLIVTLYTNGTLITQEWVDWIAKIPPTKISITMYGASPETYEKVTGSRSAFHLVERAIDMLLEQGIKVELKTTWVKSSVDDYYKLYQFAENKGLQLYVVNYVFPSENNSCSNPLGNRLDPELLAKKEIEIENFLIQKSPPLVIKEYLVDSFKPEEKKDSDSPTAFSCNAGVNSFWLSWRGEMLPCGVMTIPKVKIENNNFKNAWEQINEVINEIPVCSTCKDCDVRRYCLTCPARLYAEKNTFNEAAEYLCKHARMRSRIINNN